MTQAHKIIKYLAIALALFIVVGIVSGVVSIGSLIFGQEPTILTEDMVQTVFEGDITALKIDVIATSLTIVTGDEIKVETNNPKVKSSLKNGILTVKEEGIRGKLSVNSDMGSLVVTVPEALLSEVEISTGAGKVDIEYIVTEKLSFDFGAGAVTVEQLYVSDEAEIDCGAGKVTVKGGSIAGLDLDMGVGEVEITSALKGRNEISCGVGNLKLNLAGDQNDYKMTLSKGIGAVSVAGKSMSDGTYGDGDTYLDIDGGVGNIKIDFYIEEVF